MALEPLAELRGRVDRASVRRVAIELGFSAGYIGDVLYKRRPPSDHLIHALGLERIVTYRRRK